MSHKGHKDGRIGVYPMAKEASLNISEDKLREFMVRSSNEVASRILREFADKTIVSVPEIADVSQDYRDGVRDALDVVRQALRDLADGLEKQGEA